MLKLSKVNAFVFLIGLAILGFITVKASISSFTHDESFSYLHYVHTSFMDIISFREYYTNNHILNSLGMKYSEVLFGTSEIALRLPNLILFAVYMTYSFLLFRKQNTWVLISMFVILSTNNYLIDLFGLARGYGLSIGFMVMSIYHFIQSFYTQKTKNILLFHLASLLAILSSFVLLDVYFALLIIYNLVIIIDLKLVSNHKINLFTINKIHIIPFAIIVIVLYEPIRKVIMYSRLDFGGKTSFYNDTVSYLVNYSLNTIQITPNGLAILKVIFTFFILGTTLLIIRMIIKRNLIFWTNNKALIILNFLLVLLATAITLQHLIFNADYPIARFSIFLMPIFFLQLGFLLSYLSKYYHKPVAIFITSLAVTLSFNFLSSANLHSCFEWEYEMHTENMVHKLSEYHARNNPQLTNASLGINWLFEPTVNFYRQTYHYDWLRPLHRYGLSPNDDYYYCFEDEINDLEISQYTIIANFPEINTVLVKNHKIETP